jgi:hypothetical protein
MVDSPAYRLNHEEIIKALEEGIAFAENMDPARDHRGRSGSGESVRVTKGARWPDRGPGTERCWWRRGPCRTSMYEKELPGTFALDSKKRFFQATAAERSASGVTLTPDPRGFFTSYNQGGRVISYYGDNHPAYAGNVVKAMASAKHGYPHVVALFPPDEGGDERRLRQERIGRGGRWPDNARSRAARARRVGGASDADDRRRSWCARRPPRGTSIPVSSIACRTSNRSRLARSTSRRCSWKASRSPGAWVDERKGLLSLIALELGVSSRLCAYLKPGEPVVVMGPTGHADGDSARRGRAARGRRTRQRGAVLDCERRCATTATASSISPGTATAPTCSNDRRSRPAPIR